jgi:hypothetical protein
MVLVATRKTFHQAFFSETCPSSWFDRLHWAEYLSQRQALPSTEIINKPIHISYHKLFHVMRVAMLQMCADRTTHTGRPRVRNPYSRRLTIKQITATSCTIPSSLSQAYVITLSSHIKLETFTVDIHSLNIPTKELLSKIWRFVSRNPNLDHEYLDKTIVGIPKQRVSSVCQEPV